MPVGDLESLIMFRYLRDLVLALAWHSIELMAPEHSPRAANLLSMIGGQGWAEVFARRQI